MKKYIVSLVLVLVVGHLFAQAVYITTGVNGNWNNTLTWDGSLGTPDGDADGLPDSDDDVYILHATTVNVTANVLNLHVADISGILLKSGFGSRVINVSGFLSGDDGAGGPLSPTLNVFNSTAFSLVLSGSGTVISDWSTTSPIENLSLTGTGAVTIASDIAIGGGTFSISGPASVNINGDLENDGTHTVSVPVVFNKGSVQVISGTAPISFGSTATFNNAMDFNTNATFSSTVTAGGNALSFAGDFINNGTFNSTGTITFDGSSTQSIAGSSSTSFENLTISNTTGTVTIGGGGSSIEGTLSVANGGTLATGGVLTLVSNASGTASVSDLTGALVTGNVVYQRYFDGSLDVWRNFGIGVSAGLVTDITSAGYTVNGGDLGYYDESADDWVAQSTFGAGLLNSRGYSLYTRAEDGNETVSFTGTLNTGTQNMTVTRLGVGGDPGWNLVNNPYASTIDFDLLTRSNLDNNVAVWNTVSNGYDYWNGSTGNLTNGLIASGQGFWVHSTTGTPSLTINETDKSVTSTSFLRTEPEPLINHLIVKLGQSEKMDKTFIHFREDASDDYNPDHDAIKRLNGIYNLSSKATTGEFLAINSMSSLSSCSSTISMNIDNISEGTYELGFEDVNSFGGLTIVLFDNFSDTSTDISEGSIYSFDVTKDAASWGDTRFELQFSQMTISTSLTYSTTDNCESSEVNVSIGNSQLGLEYKLLSGSTIVATSIGTGNSIYFNVDKSTLVEGINDFDVAIENTNASCSASELLTSVVSVNYNATISVESVTDGNACASSSVGLSAKGAPENGFYKWYDSAEAIEAISGENAATYTTGVLTASNTYFVAIVNANNCEGPRMPVNAVINELPNSPKIAGVTECKGDMASLVASGTTDGNYKWYNSLELSAPPIEGATNGIYETEAAGDYYVSIINEFGCESDRVHASVVINQLPNVPGVVGATECEGSIAVLVASGTTDGNYKWYNSSDLSALPIEGVVNGVYETEVTGDYYVSISNEFGCESGRVLVSSVINELPNSPQVVDATECEGNIAILVASGTTDGNYKWYNSPELSALPIEDVVNGVYETMISGDYYVSITNEFGCESDRVLVSSVINELPNSPQVVGATECEGNIAILVASGTTDGNYKWYNSPELSELPIEGVVNGIYETELAGDYYVSITNELGCESDRVIASVIINELPIAEITSIGDKLISNSADGNQWYKNDEIILGATSNEYEVVESGNYTVEVENEYGCRSSSESIVMTITSTLTQSFGDVKMNIYPNPLGDESLTVASSSLSSYIQLLIFDRQGKRVLSEEVNLRDEIQVDLSQFNKGIYFIHLTGENGNAVYKILKK
jgi:hypothetical protein